MRRQPWQLSPAERAANSARIGAEIADANARQAVFDEGYAAGVDHWPPCSNPYLGIDREKARAWSQGRAAAAPGSDYARHQAECVQRDRDWRAAVSKRATKVKQS